MTSGFQNPGRLLEVTTRSPEATYLLGKRLGEQITTGAILALFGELGSGKTVFVQGLARGLGVPENDYVTSPTYTLIHEYTGRLRLFHADLYRIGNPEEIEDIGLSELLEENCVTAIEWADRLPADFLSARIHVRFEIRGRVSRKILFTPYGHAESNLVKALRKTS